MKRNILLLISIFLLTGCSVNYKLTINTNLSVKEEATVNSDSEIFKYYNDKSRADVLSSMIDLEPDYKSNYDIKIDDSNAELPSLYGDKSYSDLDNFINNSLLIREYFNNVEYELKDGILVFRANEFVGNNEFLQGKHDIDYCRINIKTDLAVLETNTKVLGLGNTYEWDITDDTNEMSIYMKIDTTKKYYQVENFWIKVVALLAIIILGTSIIKTEINRKKVYKKVYEEDFDDIDLV